MDWITEIIKCFEKNSVFYTKHAKFEMEHEEYGRIFENDVFEAICCGEIIEIYLDDKPYPSVLIYGKTSKNYPLHIVCGYDKEEELAIIITAYHPNPRLWIEYKRRRKT